MNKKILLLIVIILATFSENLKAWDTTAAKFYPLKIGNTYIYQEDDLSFFCVFLKFRSKFQVKIISDTIMPNGQKYFTFEGFRSFDHWKFQRIDSNSMNVYAYYINSEVLIDSLFAKKDNYFLGKRNINSVFGKVDDTLTAYQVIPKTNIYRRAKYISNNGTDVLFSYFLAEDFGFTYLLICSDTEGSETTLSGCVINGIVFGDTTLTDIKIINNNVVDKFYLSQNYPNPFNPNTVISYQLGVSSYAKLKVYDILGNEVVTLVGEKQNAGSYSVEFDASNYSSGIYYYKLEAGDFSEVKKMILIK